MKNFFKYLVCGFFGHDYDERVEKINKNTSNIYPFCPRCGKEFEPYGTTTFGVRVEVNK